LQLIKEAHTSKVAGHFGVGKIVANVHRYVYWPKTQEYVAQLIKGCILYCTKKPSNGEKGLYHSLHVPTKHWDIISMDFVGGFPTTRKGCDYLFVVVDRFNKMCILMPCKNTIKGQEVAKMFFEQIWVYFGIPRSTISDRDRKFLNAFWTALWEKIDTKLKRSTTFHPWIEVINMIFGSSFEGLQLEASKDLG
jgi:hypothetical protein